MSHVKTIEAGENIETYEYDNPPFPHLNRGRRKREKIDEDEKFEKRADNVMQTQRNFKRLVSANLEGEKPLLLSLTYRENMQDISIGYKDFKSFIQALRYKYGKGFKYIAVPEFQKRGAVHFHALFWGLPHQIFLEEKETRAIAQIWEMGFVDIKQTDGHGKISTYLAKYMAKAFVDKRLRNQKAYVSSRNINRPIIDHMILPILHRQDEGELETVMDRVYNTRHMGKCRYRLFKKKKVI